MKKALVVAAHPDDEILGCGGTIAKLVDRGWRVDVLIMSEGATSRSSSRNVGDYNEELQNLMVCATKANKILGSSSVKFLSLPDNRMDGMQLLDVVKLIELEITTNKPELILTHHSGDVNIDHRIIHDAVIAATRPYPGQVVKTLLFFEIPSSTEWRPSVTGSQFSPNYYHNISEYIDIKIEALLSYVSEIREFPHPRSSLAVEYLAKWRGATIGCDAAEAFMLGRCII